MWLPPIIVVPKKNEKLRIYVDFIKLNVVTNKDPYPLHVIDEALLIPKNIVVYYLTFFLVFQIKTSHFLSWSINGQIVVILLQVKHLNFELLGIGEYT